MTDAAEQVIVLTARKGRIALRLTAVAMGRDLTVALAGGEREHIGAVALAQARPSLEEGGATSATTSVLALYGHKEDELARALAAQLASRLDAAVCVACGIHLDAIRKSELQDVAALVAGLAEDLIGRLRPA